MILMATPDKRPWRVLILCTGNSARSILAEYLLRAKGKGRFEVHSAGSHPAGQVNSLAVRALREKYNLDASNARSKSWDEFAGGKFDLVITVCDNAKESCPLWPGQPVITHWSSPDPAAVAGTEDEKYRFFVSVASQIAKRVEQFCTFPENKLIDAAAVQGVGDQFKLEGESGMQK